MTNKEKHQELLKEFYSKYEPILNETKEFVFDGPSNWELYENSTVKIMFLVKESRNGYHPSVPNQKTNTKFMRNLARWKCLINDVYLVKSEFEFPSNSDLPETIDDVAIVEVKKINVENITSNQKDLRKFALNDKLFLQRQIDIINPQIIVCCYTIDCFNIIFDNKFEVSKRLFKKDGTSSAEVDKRLIIDFFHPSTWGFGDPGPRDKELYKLLTEILLDNSTQNFIKS